jgi:hypothetical protein
MAENPTPEPELTPEGDAPEASKPRTYSKAEVDGMVKKAQLAIRKEFGDVLELRTKAEQFDALQESSKSDLEKERGRADRVTRERDAALTRSKSTLIRSAIISAASRLGSVDPEAVAALLPQDELIVEGDEVLGVEDAVKALLAKKAYLRPGAARSGVEISPGQPVVTAIPRSQIKQWLRSGEMTPERITQVEEANKAGKILTDR